MGIQSLHACFFPAKVAVIGANGRPCPLEQRLVANLASGNFKGTVYHIGCEPVTDKGIAVYPDLASVPDPLDLALITSPIEDVTGLIEECANHRVKGAVVLARGTGDNGFSESLRRLARKINLRLIGPRSWGVVSPWVGLNAGLNLALPASGGLAVVSQSAAICANIVDLARARNIGLSLVVGLGDTVETDCADILDYLANHSRVQAIMLHVEKLTGMRKFMSAAGAAARVKPVMILKTGRSGLASSDDGTPFSRLIDEDDVYDAAFRRAGLVRVKTVEDLFSCSDLIGKQKAPLGGRLVILTNTRSPGIMAADSMRDCGIEPIGLTKRTIQLMETAMGNPLVGSNPVNLTVDAPPPVWQRVFELCRDADDIDGVLAIMTPRFMTDPVETARITAAMASSPKPVFVVWMGGPDFEAGRKILQESGIAVYNTPEKAVQAFAYLRSFTENLSLLQEVPPRSSNRLVPDKTAAQQIITSALSKGQKELDAYDAMDFLACYGLPVIETRRVMTCGQALQQAESIKYPIKLIPLTHQGVHDPKWDGRRDLMGPQDVVTTWEAILTERTRSSQFEPMVMLIQPVIRPISHWLRMGSRQIEPFGPVVLFGQGGIPCELAMDQAIGLPPLNRQTARLVMAQTKVGRLLADPDRSTPKALAAVEEIMVRLSEVVTDFPELSELEIEPLLLSGGEAWVTRARALVRTTPIRPPMHMIIRPYPSELETVVTIKAGTEIFIRPLKPEDADLYREFWNQLSPESIYYRFSTHLKELHKELLVRFTQPDYDREIALAAMERLGVKEKMLAVARLLWSPEPQKAEFSIKVADPWQGQGIGAELLKRIIIAAQRRSIKSIWGLVLRGNHGMIELAKKLGFAFSTVDDLSQIEITLNLDDAMILDNGLGQTEPEF